MDEIVTNIATSKAKKETEIANSVAEEDQRFIEESVQNVLTDEANTVENAHAAEKSVCAIKFRKC